jgi:hypothetical protein
MGVMAEQVFWSTEQHLQCPAQTRQDGADFTSGASGRCAITAARKPSPRGTGAPMLFSPPGASAGRFRLHNGPPERRYGGIDQSKDTGCPDSGRGRQEPAAPENRPHPHSRSSRIIQETRCSFYDRDNRQKTAPHARTASRFDGPK